MIAGAMIVGIGGAMLSAGGALALGKPLLTVAGCYMAGGSASMLLTLVLGRRAGPGRGPERISSPAAQPAVAG